MNTISGFGPGFGVTKTGSPQETSRAQFITIDAERVSPTPHGSTQVSLSEDVSAVDSKGKMLVEKYEESIADHQKSQAPEQAEGANSLHELAPLHLFNQGDVDAYDKLLTSKLAELGIDTSEAISFQIDSEGKVRVKGDHPQKEAIEKMFSEDMDLRNGMVQTQTFYLFKEMYQLHQQWAEKIEAGVNEEIAGTWLLSSVKMAVSKSSEGLTFQNGKSADPFASSGTASLAAKAYGG